jgi:SLT domain-containing protein
MTEERKRYVAPYQAPVGTAGTRPYGHATGWVGNTEHLARIAEGGQREAVIPLEDRGRRDAMLSRAGLPVPGDRADDGRVREVTNNWNVTFSGPVATGLVAWEVINRLQFEQRQRMLALMSGYR